MAPYGMQTLPIASFLAGALLTITVPAGLFVVISYLYMRFLRRAPEAANPAPPAQILGPGSSAAPPAEASAYSGMRSDASGDARRPSTPDERPAESHRSPPSPPAEP